MGQILVAVDTDVGLRGYGVGGGGAAGVHVVRTVLRDLLLGADPEPIETIWQRMYKATLPFGRKGLAIMALSGLDLALWDLRGKAAQLPLAEVLGGTVGTPIPAYATIVGEPEKIIAQGYQAVKIHFMNFKTPPTLAQVVDFAGQIRDKIGPQRRLMLDAFMTWDVPTTLNMEQALRPFELDWIEEPLLPDDWAGYAQLTDKCQIPIAGGEHEYTSAAFLELIERKLHQVLQPDVCWCGGLTELVKIYRAAQAAGVRVCPHRGSEPWSLHAIAALDSHPLAESPRPWMHWVQNAPQIINGFVTLGDSAGFGIEIDEGLLP